MSRDASYAGSDFEDEYDYIDEYVAMYEPFLTLFRTRDRSPRWGDAVANLADLFGVPKGSRHGAATAKWLLSIADSISEAWDIGDAKPNHSRAHTLVYEAVYLLTREDVEEMVMDFGWLDMPIRPKGERGKASTKPITLANFETELRRAVIYRLTERTVKVLRKAHNARDARAA